MVEFWDLIGSVVDDLGQEEVARIIRLARLEHGARQILLESTDEEIADALRGAGIDLDECATRGRATVNRAIAETNRKQNET